LPVYPLTEGLSQKNLRKTISAALRQYARGIEDEIPSNIIEERKLLHKSDAIMQIHCPTDLSQMQEARRTLIYEELYQFEYKMAQRALDHRGKLPSLEQSAVFEAAGKSTDSSSVPSAAPFFETPAITRENFEAQLSPRQKELYSRLPFSLTQGQMAAIAEMNMDVDRSQDECNWMLNKPEKLTRNPFSMQRLLQGDVGSGKTLVAFFVCLRTIDYGGQCVLMAPTELLAKQHAENAAKLLEPIGVKVAFLTGNTKASGRTPLINALKNGVVNIAVGTHALFSRNIQYKNLQMAVIDEQHRFGVKQREKLLIKQGASGEVNSVHNLVMTATPIPRTLAMVLYGDMATSIIKQKPAGRQTIKTWFVDSRTSPDITDVLKSKLEAGEQAYIVCAKIDDEHMEPDDGYRMTPDVDESEIISVVQMKEMIDKTGLSGRYTTETLYGSMNEAAKLDVMERFVRGEVKILISTTVIEVGVDNPNANVMVIMDADRFGLSTLHQLRGRIGRGSSKSFCLLVSESRSELALQRIKMMCESSDGFELAQKDLELRGPGDFFGTRQHGIPSLRAANLYTDIAIASEACEAVNKVFEEKTEEASVLYNAIASMFELRFGRKMGSL
ncbi:MAG: ATP-dependent DNA helicase RecG, partial [Candidatus Methanomethylophilaceae archaeon]|nr:ATP-dependent DNA helicase RecG [Candidatus Methanomethylophilaceae archaeon]